MTGAAFAMFPEQETCTQTLLPSLRERIGRRDDFSPACAREAHRHKAVKIPSVRWVLLLDTGFSPFGSRRNLPGSRGTTKHAKERNVYFSLETMGSSRCQMRISIKSVIPGPDLTLLSPAGRGTAQTCGSKRPGIC